MTIATTGQIVLVMLLWAACFPLITVGIEFSPHLTFAALRALLAGLILTALALAMRQPLPKDLRSWATLAGVGIGATSLGFIGMFHAAEFVSPGIATVIASTQPLLAAVLASIVLREKLRARGRAGLALGFVGILVITSPQLLADGQGGYLLGITYIALAALGITVSNVLIKHIAGSISALMAMGLQMLIGSIPLIIGAWVAEEPVAIEWSLTFLGALLALSVFGTALVYWMWFSILEKTPLNQANAFSFLIPIFGLTLGVLFYGEAFDWRQLAGIALAIFGVGLVAHHGTMPRVADERSV